jgi:GT2 family glycosyltransferase
MPSRREAHEKTAVLVVMHDSARHLPALLRSLERWQYEHVYFCDAASRDDSAELVRRSAYARNLLVRPRLEGFAHNNNALLAHFAPPQPYLLALNPDVYFDADIVAGLVAELERRPRAAVVAPMLLNPDGSPQGSWRRFPSLVEAARKRFGLDDGGGLHVFNSGAIDWCLGACMLVRRSALVDPSRLFDERYRLYCEDADLCFSVTRAGYSVYGTAEVEAWHHLGQASTRRRLGRHNLWNLTSAAKFLAKWNLAYFRRESLGAGGG